MAASRRRQNCASYGDGGSDYINAQKAAATRSRTLPGTPAAEAGGTLAGWTEPKRCRRFYNAPGDDPGNEKPRALSGLENILVFRFKANRLER